MAILQVRPGSGTSGDGSTWEDDSSPTAAYIDWDGLVAASVAAGPGDLIVVRGNIPATFTPQTLGADGIAKSRNPVRLYGVKPGTVNNQAAIDVNDLIPGQMTGAGPGVYAYDDPGLPLIQNSGDITIFGGWRLYGVGFQTFNTQAIALNSGGFGADFEARIQVAECLLEGVGANRAINIQYAKNAGYAELWNSHLKLEGTASQLRVGSSGIVKFRGGKVTRNADAIAFFNAGASNNTLDGVVECYGTEFAGGALALAYMTYLSGRFTFNRCQFPVGYSLVSGTRGQTSGRVVNLGSGVATSGITTSEQNFQEAQFAGDLDLETTVVRTGGASDNQAGPFSIAMLPIAGNTKAGGGTSLVYNLGQAFLPGDGTSKTIRIFITSDAANIKTVPWGNDELGVELEMQSAAGASGAETLQMWAPLLGAPTVWPDDLVSIWGGGIRHQYLDIPVAPDFAGMVRPRVCFAPENGDVIYVDPLWIVV